MKQHIEFDLMMQASDTGDWDLLRQGLKIATCKIRHEHFLEVVSFFVRIFLDEFSHKNQLHDLPFKTSEISKPYLEDLVTLVTPYRGKPGVNNFIRSLNKCKIAMEASYCETDYIDSSVTTIINLFISIPSQTWGNKNPDLHNRWLHGTTNEDLYILVEYYAKDTEVINQKKQMIIQLVEMLQKYYKSDSE